jgi:hypothetical protein
MISPVVGPETQLRLFDPEEPERLLFSRYVLDHALPWLRTNGATEETLQEYRESAALFAVFAGDPPIELIGRKDFSCFKEALKTLPARRGRRTKGEDYALFIRRAIQAGGSPIAVNTRRKHEITVNRLLRIAGPAKYADDDGLGLLGKPPQMRPEPAEIDENVEVYTEAEYELWRSGSVKATVPRASYTGF